MTQTITSSEETNQIGNEIRATEKARQELEHERVRIENEKRQVAMQQYEITKERLRGSQEKKKTNITSN